MRRNVQDIVVILEEEKHFHPHFPSCDLFIPWSVLNCHQPAMSLCVWVVERKRRRLVEEEARAGAVTAF